MTLLAAAADVLGGVLVLAGAAGLAAAGAAALRASSEPLAALAVQTMIVLGALPLMLGLACAADGLAPAVRLLLAGGLAVAFAPGLGAVLGASFPPATRRIESGDAPPPG